ncbi:hypothetical protein VIMY103929_09140 [Vibrio mytili]
MLGVPQNARIKIINETSYESLVQSIRLRKRCFLVLNLERDKKTAVQNNTSAK